METRDTKEDLLTDIKAFYISEAEKEGFAGEELEAFKRGIDLYFSRGASFAKMLNAGRRAEDYTPEELAGSMEAIKSFMNEDAGRIDAIIAEDPFKKRQRETAEKMRALRNEYPDDWTMPLGECKDETAADAFLSIVEDEYKTKVKDGKHLQELTGIDELIGHTGKIKLGTPAAREEAREQMKELFKDAVEYRYQTALEAALNSGAKYKDLLAIDPEAYGITGESIIGTEDAELARWDKGTYQKEKIREAIGFWASLMEGSLLRPDLHTIAEKLEAPYNEIWLAADRF
jgi:hypothetical protein